MSITIEQHAADLKKLIDASKQKALERIIVPAANELLATIKDRIHLDGENSGGQKIGTYSTKPMYAGINEFDNTGRFKPQGKGGFTGKKLVSEKKYKVIKKKLKSGKIQQRVVSENKYRVEKVKIGTMYLPQGYMQLRSVQGKPVDKMNLTYRGDLMADYQQRGAPNAVLQGFTSEFQSKIRKGIEKKRGFAIFKPQNEEMEAYEKNVVTAQKAEVLKLLKSA